MATVDPKIFSPVLGKEEEIIETFKPNFKRELVLNLICLLICAVLFIGLPIVFVIALTNGSIQTEGDNPWLGLIPWCVMIGLFMLIGLIGIVFGYKKKAFCITNKRIIIRSGIIGTDFKTLEFDLIGGVSVTVGLLDKLVKPNTGRISFASAASPVVNNMKGVSVYAFTAIENPYETYQRIKEIYDNYKANKQ